MPTDTERMDFIEMKVIRLNAEIVRGKTMWTCSTFENGHSRRGMRKAIDAAMRRGRKG